MNLSLPVLQKPYLPMLAAAVGAALGAGVILFDAGATAESRRFIDTPEFWVWLTLICAQTALFAVVMVPLGRLVGTLRGYFTGNVRDILLSTLVVGLLFWAPAGASRIVLTSFDSWPLAHHSFKMLVIVGLAFFTGLVAIVGIWLVHAAFSTRFAETEPKEDELREYLSLQENLQWFMSILGAMVALGTLATGALRYAVLAAEAVTPSEYPSVLVLIYGAYYTVLVALTYIPVYTSLQAAGKGLQDAFFPLPAPDAESWQSVYSKRKTMGDVLKLQVTGGQDLRASIAILSPLVSGIISTVLS